MMPQSPRSRISRLFRRSSAAERLAAAVVFAALLFGVHQIAQGLYMKANAQQVGEHITQTD